MIEKILGTWTSNVKGHEKLVLDRDKWHKDGERGLWNVQEDEIWMIDEDLKAGIKWQFTLEGRDTLIFHDPEDFIYQGHGNYLYMQFSPANLRIVFTRSIT